MKTIISTEKRVDGFVMEYAGRQHVSFETAKDKFAKHFPEISSSDKVFGCIVSFFSFLNAHFMVEDFPHAYTVHLKGYSKEQIEAMKNSYVEQRDAAKQIFISELEENSTIT